MEIEESPFGSSDDLLSDTIPGDQITKDDKEIQTKEVKDKTEPNNDFINESDTEESEIISESSNDKKDEDLLQLDLEDQVKKEEYEDDNTFENFEVEYKKELKPRSVDLPTSIFLQTGIPKMKSRYVMSNQEVRDLIDPNNLKIFNENIARLNHLLESSQKEYCTENYNPLKTGESNFHLNLDLLEKLIYGTELDLSGNFLQQTVGRRLNDNDMPKLVEFLINDTIINRLTLPYNDISDEGMLKLSEALLARPDIVHLNIAHSDLTPSGCYEFLWRMMKRSSFHSLKLAGMKIGDEGFNGLICLFLCGKGPNDLDIGETDMGMASFQGLCSAWEAIDQGEDYPKYLTKHPLPISLDELARMKAFNDDDKRQENLAQYRRSLVDLVDNSISKNEGKLEKIIFPDKIGGEDSVKVMEKVSVTILEGLFKIPQKSQEIQLTSLSKEEKAKMKEISLKSKELPDTTQIVQEYRKIRDAGCMPFDENGRPVIVCPSLYSLDIEDPFESVEKPGEKGDHFFIPTILEEMVAQPYIVKNNKPAEEVAANKAATKIVNRAFQEAAQFASTTDFEEKSDSTQLLLSIVLETCQQVREWEDSNLEFNKNDLDSIWEAANQKAIAVFENLRTLNRCSVKPGEITGFVKAFMASTHRTMMQLLNNPSIPPLLVDTSTKCCRNTVDLDKVKPIQPYDPTEANKPNYTQRIVTSFLEGAVSEAAHLIGSGDPFSFRIEPLGSKLGKSKHICSQLEHRIEGILEDFFVAGAMLSKDAIEVKQALEKEEAITIAPAASYLEEIFDQVAELLIATEEVTYDKHNMPIVVKFPHAGRPTRLVLNRPIFRNYEAIMGLKIGDFFRQNTSVKCVHLRKWGLGEEGMLSLMDGLVHNQSMVVLDLGSNGIGPEGTKLLAKFIQQNQNLKHLILNHNCLREPGIKYLAEALPESLIEFLNIAYNDISDLGLNQLLDTIPMTHIRSLYALGNNFSQTTWQIAKELFEIEALIPEFCDYALQEVDGKGMIVTNAQIRDTNEWYDVPPTVADGLKRAPYFEVNAHYDIPNILR